MCICIYHSILITYVPWDDPLYPRLETNAQAAARRQSDGTQSAAALPLYLAGKNAGISTK